MRHFPRQASQLISVYHLPTTKVGQTQDYPATPDLRIDAALLPMDRKNHALEGLVLVDPFEVYLPATDDVRVGDKIVIDSGTYAGTYYCKKRFLADIQGMPHRRCSVSLEI